MPKVSELQRELDHLRGLTRKANIRPLFHLHAKDGTPLRYVTISGTTVRGGPQGSDVVFTMLEEVYNLLSSGQRYVVLHGGRGSTKSYSFGQWVLAQAILKPTRILCSREVQASIKESVKSLLEEIINTDPRLQDFFDSSRDWITGKNGSYFLFKGLREYTVDALRSLQGIGLCWLEEGQSVSDRSWETLIPTIRKDGSQILVSMNITTENDPIYKNFIGVEEPHPYAAVGKFNLEDNPWAPEVLRMESAVMKERDPERWLHVYGGELRTLSEDRILNNWVLQDFDLATVIANRQKLVTDNYKGTLYDRKVRMARRRSKIANELYVGSDLGFGDVGTHILVYRDADTRTLYVCDEFVRAGMDPEDLAEAHVAFLTKNELDKYWPVYYDNSRPELIAFLRRRKMLNAKACTKLKLADRIDQIKAWNIIVKPGLEHITKELALYSWRRDAQGSLQPVPEDRNNHCIDALFYAVGDSIVADHKKAQYRPLNIGIV